MSVSRVRSIDDLNWTDVPRLPSDGAGADPLRGAAGIEVVFGPVVVALPFDGEDDAVRLANDSRYGRASSVWLPRPISCRAGQPATRRRRHLNQRLPADRIQRHRTATRRAPASAST
ncbi:aldehyde dehydrogenase family protein [Micromonospora sp. NPDC003776]